MTSHRHLVASCLLAGLAAATPAAAQTMSGAYPQSYYRAPEPSVERSYMMQLKEMDAEPPLELPSLAASTCDAGDAAGYPCSNVDLMSFLPLDQIGGGSGNDIWGWTDPLTGNEYALMGRTSGTAFVDITDPENPVYLGNLATQTSNSTWRDIKVYADHAFIVSEASDHGMQVFDLAQLRSVAAPPVEFVPTAHYGDFGNAHNIVINEDTGFAYAVGTGTCAGGLHIVNIQNPLAPTFANCFDSDGYTHDAQCVLYDGPDTTYLGREICLGYNEDTLTVVDVTDKSAPIEISRTGYSNRGYTHQGWLSDDHAWAVMNDELDESRSGITTRTLVWNMSDLDAPVHAFSYDHGVAAIDHNLYIKDNLVYLSNYRHGLRILDMSCVDSGSLLEVGHFDIYPNNDNASFSGTWSNYPYFDSGVVIVSGIGEGLFVLRPNIAAAPPPPTNLGALDTGSNQIDLDWDDVPAAASYVIERAEGGCGGSFVEIGNSTTSSFSDPTVSGSQTYGYIVQSSSPLGCKSACIEIAASGDCHLTPTFAGASGVANPFRGDGVCELEVRWPGGSGRCSPDLAYNVYRSATPGFTPDPSNLVAACVTGNAWTDASVAGAVRYHYIVRAEDTLAVGPGGCGGVEESNGIEVAGLARSTASLADFVDGAESSPQLSIDAPWAVTSDDARSGALSFRIIGDDRWTCGALTSPPFVATATTVLSYAHREENIEDTWDGGTVELSLDGGVTWALAQPSPDYPSSFDNRSSSCNNDVRGGGVYTGDSGGFQDATVDLSAYAGQEVTLRFRFGTDRRVDSDGFWIDDVLVTDMAVGDCVVPTSGHLYRSTVADVAAGWKAAVPLPLTAASNIDSGWPRTVTTPMTESDLGALSDAEPLMIYRLLDGAGDPIGNLLRVVKDGAADVSISF